MNAAEQANLKTFAQTLVEQAMCGSDITPNSIVTLAARHGLLVKRSPSPSEAIVRKPGDTPWTFSPWMESSPSEAT